MQQAGIINTIFALLFAVIILAFFWGLMMYWVEIGSDEAKKEYKDVILGSVTWLFLLMCIYAVVEWVRAGIGI